MTDPKLFLDKRLEAIDLLGDSLNPALKGIKAGPYKSERLPDGSLSLSQDFAENIWKEAFHYREFHRAASDLAFLVNQAQKGKFVNGDIMNTAKARYAKAVQDCRDMMHLRVINRTDVKQEK